jgi:hypothetical protein
MHILKRKCDDFSSHKLCQRCMSNLLLFKCKKTWHARFFCYFKVGVNDLLWKNGQLRPTNGLVLLQLRLGNLLGRINGIGEHNGHQFIILKRFLLSLEAGNTIAIHDPSAEFRLDAGPSELAHVLCAHGNTMTLHIAIASALDQVVTSPTTLVLQDPATTTHVRWSRIAIAIGMCLCPLIPSFLLRQSLDRAMRSSLPVNTVEKLCPCSSWNLHSADILFSTVDGTIRMGSSGLGGLHLGFSFQAVRCLVK